VQNRFQRRKFAKRLIVKDLGDRGLVQKAAFYSHFEPEYLFSNLARPSELWLLVRNGMRNGRPQSPVPSRTIALRKGNVPKQVMRKRA
jgi:hypothetical protein